ncbi:MAG: TolC family protein [Bacteroidetes bacterium]|nr:TolC family protein [Bacteroidota bacterium]
MKSFISLIFISIISIANAQQVLTVEDALKTALKNNYGILISRNETEISKTNNTAGNAGMLPNISAFGNGNFESNNVNQNYAGGTSSSYNGLTTISLNAGTELSWTLFDGGKMFVTKNKLSEIEALSEIQLKDKIFQTQYDVISAYFDVVRQKQQLTSINEIIKYNTELVKILEISFNAGSIAKNNLLQAKIDLNVYKENAINQEYVIIAAKKTLNQLIGVSIDSPFEVNDSIPLNYTFNKAEINKKLFASNTTILSFQKEIDIAKLSLTEYNRMRYPLINLKAGYYYSHTDNSAGSLLKNQAYGPQIGGSISIPLYQSAKINRQISIASIEIQSATFNLENLKSQLNKDLQNAIVSYENQQRLLDIEKENNAFAKENLEISLQRLKLGQTNTIEVHLAQENYVQSMTRLINFKYNLKIAETKLKQLLAEL